MYGLPEYKLLFDLPGGKHLIYVEFAIVYGGKRLAAFRVYTEQYIIAIDPKDFHARLRPNRAGGTPEDLGSVAHFLFGGQLWLMPQLTSYLSSQLRKMPNFGQLFDRPLGKRYPIIVIFIRAGKDAEEYVGHIIMTP